MRGPCLLYLLFLVACQQPQIWQGSEHNLQSGCLIIINVIIFIGWVNMFSLCCVLISLWLSVLPILYLQLEEMWGWSRGSHHSQHLTATSTVLVPLYFGGNLWTLFGFIWFLVGQHFHNIQTKGIKCLQLLLKEKKKEKKGSWKYPKASSGI